MKHIHIIGIAGTFMGSLAALAQEAGYRVTGCDHKIYPPMSTQLEQLGIDVIEGFEAEQLDYFPADIYIIGNVATRGMPVIEAILNRQLPYTSGPQWLSENILHTYHVLAVAGTHGKTTTSSMLAWILEKNGYHCGFLIGGVPQNFAISARLPAKNQPAYFVIEADEYDTAFFDKRSKFVHYRPHTLIINNLEFDHADIFADLQAIQTQFHHLIRTVPSTGRIVFNDTQKSIQEVLQQGYWSELEPFGDHAGFWAKLHDNQQDFTVMQADTEMGVVHWDLIGTHNIMNALAAIAAADHIGIAVADACHALSGFANVKRRMEVKGCINHITVYDDFAHHPTAISTTIEGLRNKVGQARILAVLEPRSNTMKLGTMKNLLPDSLKQANHVFCYSGNIDWDVAEALAPLGNKAQVIDDFDELLANIVQTAQAGDHILIMSNGGFNGIHHKLIEQLKG